jgi:hypothetical protein
MLRTYKGLTDRDLDGMSADRFMYFLPYDELEKATAASGLSRPEFLAEVERRKSARESEIDRIVGGLEG